MKVPLDREAAIAAAFGFLDRDPGLAELTDAIARDDPDGQGADAIEGAIALWPSTRFARPIRRGARSGP